jgi:hypothetical protein
MQKMVGRQELHAESAPNELASKAPANGKLEKLFRDLTGASGKVRLQTSPLAINAEIADFNFLTISLRPERCWMRKDGRQWRLGFIGP